VLKLLTALLMISIILASGCVGKTESGGTTATTLVTGEEITGATGTMTEDQAFNTIEKEMNETAENIDISGIENSIAG
jgi:ABC-type glycerol-3-phosphate transport system substrate-binding protein